MQCDQRMNVKNQLNSSQSTAIVIMSPYLENSNKTKTNWREKIKK